MRRVLPLLIACLWFCDLLGQVLVPVADPAAALETYAKVASVYKTISASYSQEKEVPYMAVPLMSYGLFYANDSEQYRWEQSDPEHYILILSSESAHVFEDGEWKSKDLGRNKQYTFISQILSAMVSGEIQDSGFTVECRENDTLLEVTMTPIDKRVRNFVGRIVCTARKSDYLLERIVMTDANGSLTTITFAGQQADLALDDHIFKPAK